MKTKRFYTNVFVSLMLMICISQVSRSQTCTSNDPLLCAGMTPDLTASFTAGNAVTNVLASGLVFTGTAIGNPNELSLTSRLYTIPVGSGGCVIVQFAQTGTAAVTSTDVNITTSTGLTLTCAAVTVTGGIACVRICDPGLADGTMIRVDLDFNITPGSGTVVVQSFAIVNANATNLPCPTAYVSLDQTTCTGSCDAAFPFTAGRVRVYFPSPIPIGTATPNITSVTGAGINAASYKLCLTNDAGISVERTYAEYCVYSNINLNNLPLVPLTLILQSGNLTPMGPCVVQLLTSPPPCITAYFSLGAGGGTGGGPGNAACPATTTCTTNPAIPIGTILNFSSQLRVFFTPCLPAGTPAPTLTGMDRVDANGTVLARYCFVASATSNQIVGQPICYIDYCIYSTLAGDTYFLSPPSNIRFTIGVLLGTPPAMVSNICNASANSSLPVTLLDFKARQQQQSVAVSWTTAQEVNLNHFEITRSADGINFVPLGTVSATGGVAGATYQFVDIAPQRGNNFYRLRSVDNDVSFKYSSTVLVKLLEKNSSLVSVFPNPVTDQYSIRLAGLEKGAYRIELFNAAGQVHQVKKFIVNDYDHVESMTRTPAQYPGVYWIKVINEKTNSIVATMRVFMN